MYVNYALLKWNEGNVFEHKRLAKDYERSCKMYCFHLRFSRTVPVEVDEIHQSATRNLSSFLDRMNVRKLIHRDIRKNV